MAGTQVADRRFQDGLKLLCRSSRACPPNGEISVFWLNFTDYWLVARCCVGRQVVEDLAQSFFRVSAEESSTALNLATKPLPGFLKTPVVGPPFLVLGVAVVRVASAIRKRRVAAADRQQFSQIARDSHSAGAENRTNAAVSSSGNLAKISVMLVVRTQHRM